MNLELCTVFLGTVIIQMNPYNHKTLSNFKNLQLKILYQLTVMNINCIN